MAECRSCGKPLTPGTHGPEKVYCDDVCRMRYRRSLVRSAKPSRRCIECDKVFVVTRKNRRFCCVICSARWWQRVRTARNQLTEGVRLGQTALAMVRRRWPEYLSSPGRKRLEAAAAEALTSFSGSPSDSAISTTVRPREDWSNVSFISSDISDIFSVTNGLDIPS